MPRVVMWAILTQLPFGIYGDWLTYAPVLPVELPRQILYVTILPFFLGFMLSYGFYESYLGFFLLWAVGVLVSAFIWRNTRLWWGERIISFGLLIALMAGPYLVPLMYDPYIRLVHQEYFETYLEKGSGEELNWLTEPEGILDGAIRRAQYKLDIYGCIFRLHGWSRDNKLYFDTGGAVHGVQTCSAQVWQYDPTSSPEPQLIRWLPADYVSASRIVEGPPFEEKEDTPSGGVTLAWPRRIVEESTSPDGSMRAAVIQDWNGIQFEVVVVEPSRE